MIKLRPMARVESNLLAHLTKEGRLLLMVNSIHRFRALKLAVNNRAEWTLAAWESQHIDSGLTYRRDIQCSSVGRINRTKPIALARYSIRQIFILLLD